MFWFVCKLILYMYHQYKIWSHSVLKKGNLILWFHIISISIYLLFHDKGLSWSWSYDSWIYNYMYYLCLSRLKLWVWFPLMARCTRYMIKFVKDLRQVSGFLLGTSDITEILLKVAFYTIILTLMTQYSLPLHQLCMQN